VSDEIIRHGDCGFESFPNIPQCGFQGVVGSGVGRQSGV